MNGALDRLGGSFRGPSSWIWVLCEAFRKLWLFYRRDLRHAREPVYNTEGKIQMYNRSPLKPDVGLLHRTRSQAKNVLFFHGSAGAKRDSETVDCWVYYTAWLGPVAQLHLNLILTKHSTAQLLSELIIWITIALSTGKRKRIIRNITVITHAKPLCHLLLHSVSLLKTAVIYLLLISNLPAGDY